MTRPTPDAATAVAGGEPLGPQGGRLLADIWNGAGARCVSVWWLNSGQQQCHRPAGRGGFVNGSNGCTDAGFRRRFLEKGVQRMHFRRRVPRQPAGWDGVCQIEGEFAARCRVIDISMLGVGITLDHPSPYALVGRHISVDVPAVGDSASIRLEGKITNARLTLRTTVRIGIEFDTASAELVSKVSGHSKVGLRRLRAG